MIRIVIAFLVTLMAWTSAEASVQRMRIRPGVYSLHSEALTTKIPTTCLDSGREVPDITNSFVAGTNGIRVKRHFSINNKGQTSTLSLDEAIRQGWVGLEGSGETSSLVLRRLDEEAKTVFTVEVDGSRPQIVAETKEDLNAKLPDMADKAQFIINLEQARTSISNACGEESPITDYFGKVIQQADWASSATVKDAQILVDRLLSASVLQNMFGLSESDPYAGNVLQSLSAKPLSKEARQLLQHYFDMPIPPPMIDAQTITYLRQTDHGYIAFAGGEIHNSEYLDTALKRAFVKRRGPKMVVMDRPPSIDEAEIFADLGIDSSMTLLAWKEVRNRDEYAKIILVASESEVICEQLQLRHKDAAYAIKSLKVAYGDRLSIVDTVAKLKRELDSLQTGDRALIVAHNVFGLTPLLDGAIELQHTDSRYDVITCKSHLLGGNWLGLLFPQEMYLRETADSLAKSVDHVDALGIKLPSPLMRFIVAYRTRMEEEHEGRVKSLTIISATGIAGTVALDILVEEKKSEQKEQPKDDSVKQSTEKPEIQPTEKPAAKEGKE